MARFEVLSDAVWARLEPLLPSSDGVRGRPFRDHRQVLEGIVFRYRTGCAWRDLPEEFGPWQTVWKRHRRYSADGTWDRILAVLLAEADQAGLIDWAVSVDSTINRAHQHATNLPRHTGGCVELHESLRRAAGPCSGSFTGWARHQDSRPGRRHRPAPGRTCGPGPGRGRTDVSASHVPAAGGTGRGRAAENTS